MTGLEPSPAFDLRRVRDIGELFGDSWRLFARHTVLFVTVTALVVVPVVVLLDGVWNQQLTDGPGSQGSTLASAVSGIVDSVVLPSTITALHVTILQRLADGVVPSPGEAVRVSLVRLPVAFAAVALATVLTACGFVLLIVPGFWLLVRLYFGAQSAVVDRVGPVDALRRSAETVSGRWWETFGCLLAAGLAFGVVNGVLAAVFAASDNGVAYIVLLAICSTVTMSLNALFGTLLFFSLRAHKAGTGAPYSAPAGWLPPTA
jgi:hypothetical protein